MKSPRGLPVLFALALLGFCLASPATAQEIIQKWVQRYSSYDRLSFPWSGGVVDAAGNVIVAGYVDTQVGFYDCYTAKFAAADGAILWEKIYDGGLGGSDDARALAVDSKGDVFISGVVTRNGDQGSGTRVAKLAAVDGATIWDFTNHDLSYARWLVVDHAGNLILTAFTLNTGTGVDFYTAKYNGATGALMWSRRYNGPGNGDDDISMAAVDTSNDVIVTGYSRNADSTYDIYTAKYAAVDGALLWERRYDGPAHGTDVGLALAVDPQGNVVVAGSTYTAAGNSDMYLVKYAGTGGAVLWEHIFDGPFHKDDHLVSVALDAAGNVAALGDVQRSANTHDLYTALYGGGDGALLWEHPFSGPAGSDNVPGAVTVDHAGNIVIFGGASVPVSTDFYTAKYAHSDGALLWEKYYDGPADSDEHGVSVTVDNLDNVIVVGGSSNGFGYDFATIKYGPAEPDADHDGLADAWETAHFGTTTGHAANDDADHDGIPEVMELAFDLNPSRPDPAFLPPPVNEGGYLTLTLTKRLGVTFTVESSASPAADSFSSSTTTILVNNSNTLKVRDNFPITDNAQRFLRVKVAGAP